MCPIPVDVIVKSCEQVETLFDHFLGLTSDENSFLKRHSFESNEVHFKSTNSRLQSDSGKPLPANTIQYVTRGLVTDESHDVDIIRHRRSLEIDRFNVSSPTPLSTVSDLQRDSMQTSHSERSEIDSFRGSSRPPNQFPEHRVRTLSQGPTELQLHDAAVIIAGVGDQIEQQYAGKMQGAKEALSNFIHTSDHTLQYEEFAVYINNLVGDDRDWTNFMFMMHLSRRVLIETSNTGRSVYNYFRRYLGYAFAEQVAQRADVVEFVSERPSSL